MIQAIFGRHNRENLQFFFQRCNLSTHGVKLVSRRLDLLEEEEEEEEELESSPCPALRQSESVYQPLNPSQNRCILKGEKEVSLPD